jgi:predicted nuclease of predicted toxin-antitoxin system
MAEYIGLTVKSSYSLGYKNLTDFAIYQQAKAYGKVILVSKDADFAEIINRLGSPPKLINIKIGNCDNRTLWNFLKPHINDAIQTLLESEVNIVEME